MESFIVSEGFRLGKHSLKTVTTNLWKSESPVFTVQVSWKLLEGLVRIRSIHLGLSEFLKQVFCLTILFNIFNVKCLGNFTCFFSSGSLLKSPNFFLKSSRASLITCKWETFCFYLDYENPKEVTFFLRLILTKNHSKASFSINFNLICFEGISSLTCNNKPPPLHILSSV